MLDPFYIGILVGFLLGFVIGIFIRDLWRHIVFLFIVRAAVKARKRAIEKGIKDLEEHINKDEGA